MYNVLSLALTLGSGITAICKNVFSRCVLFSLTVCGASLAGQLLKIQRRVVLSDWTAPSDTMDAVVHDAVLLLAVITVLNIAAVLRRQLHR